MVEKEMPIRTADGDITTFVVRPDGDGPFPVAMLYMDGVGYREQVKQNSRRFAADGYYCIAPDLYYRVGERLSFDMSNMASGGLKGPEAERMMASGQERHARERSRRHKSHPGGDRIRPGSELGAQGVRRLLHGGAARAARCLCPRGRIRHRLRNPSGSADYRQARLTASRPRGRSRRALLRLCRDRSNGHSRAHRRVS